MTGRLARVVLAAVLLSAGNGGRADETPAQVAAPSNWDAMFRRTEPRDLVRFPEAVDAYIEAGDGWYTQLTSTNVFQAASHSNTGRTRLLNTTFNFAAGWGPTSRTQFSLWLRGGSPIGAPHNADLSEDIGSLLDVNGSLENDALHVRELYWAQELGGRFRYSLGWIDSSYRYDFNVVANDDAANFVSAALVNTPSIPFPENSFGLDGQWRIGERVDMHAGIYQTSCDSTGLLCLDKPTREAWLAPVEATYRIDLDGLGHGSYRLLGFASREGASRGTGLSISIDQQVGRFTAFLRASVADPDVTEVRRFISAGFGYAAPFGRSWDAVGFGFARGKPSDSLLHAETILESYWLVRTSPFVSVTPHVQIVLNPAKNPQRDRISLVGLRVQIDL